MEEKTLVTTEGDAKHYGVCEKTSRNWSETGLLLMEHTPGGHRRIDVRSSIKHQQEWNPPRSRLQTFIF
jgi:hypothetical protein